MYAHIMLICIYETFGYQYIRLYLQMYLARKWTGTPF